MNEIQDRLDELREQNFDDLDENALEDLRFELEEMRLEIEEDLEKIKGQLTTAKRKAYVDGEYSDPDWFHRANSALGHKKRQHQLSMMLLGRVRRAASRQRSDSFAQLFVSVAREVLPQELMQQVYDETVRRGGRHA